jgi:hypothetical protein
MPVTFAVAAVIARHIRFDEARVADVDEGQVHGVARVGRGMGVERRIRSLKFEV